jgi:uncharacterized membrane protein
MVQPYVSWPALAGTAFLLGGLVAARRSWSAASGLEKLVGLGPVFAAAPLATFGAEHMVVARFVAQTIPAWIPARLFWAYFVGAALFAAAISLILRKHIRLSATLLGVMFVLFVALMHVPNATAHPGDRFPWTVALRDLAFGGGAFALAATQTEGWRARGTHWLAVAGRLMVAVPLLFFGVEYFLHPDSAPGVPLQKVTPDWVPARAFWGYATGAALLVAAGAILVDVRARTAATWLGLLMLAVTVLLYAPILATAVESPQMIDAMNYVADTLLFAGTALLLARALRDRADPDGVRQLPPAGLVRSALRKAPGVTPTRLLNVRVRWLWSAKPQPAATQASGMSRSRSRSHAARTRSRCT